MRRKIRPVSTGSMADIAFLLLVFWMMTTSMQSDQGILRKLPPIEESEPDPIADKDILDIYVNSENEILVNQEMIEIDELYKLAKSFLTNGGVFEDQLIDPKLTERNWLNKNLLTEELNVLKSSENNDEKSDKRIRKIEKQISAIEFFGEYKAIKSGSLISVQHHHGTGYESYIQIQNALQSVINDLRDDLSIAQFGMPFKNLDQKENKKEIMAIREVYPQKISEAEFKR